jgi:transcriptional regulator with GAF, ATPase, and Fis domain
MNINENDFFREATLHICGSLEIEKALWHCLLYIKKYIPVDQISLNLYDYQDGVGEVFVCANKEGGEIISHKVTLPPEIQKKKIEKRPIRHWTLDQIADQKALGNDLETSDTQNISCLVMDLVLEKTNWGSLNFLSEKGKKFSEAHIDLLKMLNEPFAVALSNSIQYRDLKNIKAQLDEESKYFQNELRVLKGNTIIGAEHGLKEVMELVRQVSNQDCPVLLLGKTGVGKEVIANAIHTSSPRMDGPLIKVNCGGIPESLMDSELFGHEKGAFTGALYQKRGRFERANGGTIFLDEIGELSPGAQVKLLRVLQEKEFERVGGQKTIKSNARVISATHRNLEDMIDSGKFREDLYFRLKVFPIKIPPLSERVNDIPSLVRHFVEKKSAEMNRSQVPEISPTTLERLMSYGWPGNIRELENSVEREIILCKDNQLAFEHIPSTEKHSKSNHVAIKKEDIKRLDDSMKEHIQHALKMADGKIAGKGGAAELLDINPRTLRHRMTKLNIPFGREASKDPNCEI